MSRPKKAAQAAPKPEEKAEDRKGMRGHEDGNVRPADGRYDLHKPEEESEVVRND
jgi:hypothetical protein